MKHRVGSVGLLLAMSGFAALVLQVGWLREFRLVFGSTTAAAAAVLAIFMAGIGLGNAVLGRWADRVASPLRWYAALLLGIAATSAISPWLIDLVRTIYTALGGQSRMGGWGSTGVRLALSAAALGLPTFLMGGTLPAAVRAVIDPSDRQRRSVGWLYGLNEAGAVVGAACSTLWLLESWGTRGTLFLAAATDFIAALLAFLLAQQAARSQPGQPTSTRRETGEATAATIATPSGRAAHAEVRSAVEARPVPWVVDSRGGGWPLYVTAAVLGFVFLLMEIVWYRMLAPLMGGSTYTFGIILTVVLAGIGLGGWTYGLLARERGTGYRVLALAIAVEGLCIAVPLALGDRVAVFAALIADLKGFGFWGAVVAWTSIAAVVVLPAAVVSGFQFPLLIAMLGHGQQDAGRQIGAAFAWNTAGAIAGSLAGGFGLIPWLTAVGAWRLAVVLLCVQSVLLLAWNWLAMLHSPCNLRASAPPRLLDEAGKETAETRRRGDDTEPSSKPDAVLSSEGHSRHPHSIPHAVTPRASLVMATLACVGCALLAMGSLGPTAVWRHGGIGAGRFVLVDPAPNNLHNQLNALRRTTIWEADGVESSVALVANNGLEFYVNGKSDGSIAVDAGTQVMLPLIGAVLHPDPRSALIVGLGTGESAGWLADVDSIRQVDVVELEPAMVHVAKACAAANRQALDNPKITLTFDDAREFVLTSPAHYDLIISEPSNPYRAGIAGLYTQEFYRSVANRLNDNGLFLQWLQTYEIDTLGVRTVMATLRKSFDHVQLWQTRAGDTVFVCGRRPMEHAADSLRLKLNEEPYSSALRDTWNTSDLEGFLAHYLAGDKLIDAVIAAQEVPINTDDQNILEYGLARTMGRQNLFPMNELRAAASRLADDRFPLSGDVDWNKVTDERLFSCVAEEEAIPPHVSLDRDQQLRLMAWQHYHLGHMNEAVQLWESQESAAVSLAGKRMLAHAYADQGSLLADPWIARLSLIQPTEAEFSSALLAARSGRPELATTGLVAAFQRLRTDPWCQQRPADSGLNLALELAATDTRRARLLWAALDEPFAVRILDSRRLATKLAIAQMLPVEDQLQDFLAFEPYVPWTQGFLQSRREVYEANKNPLAEKAARDLRAFERVNDDDPLLPISAFPTSSHPAANPPAGPAVPAADGP